MVVHAPHIQLPVLLEVLRARECATPTLALGSEPLFSHEGAPRPRLVVASDAPRLERLTLVLLAAQSSLDSKRKQTETAGLN